jgi:hypothetical protein
VVNALSSETIVEVARDRQVWRQTFARGLATARPDDRGRPASSRSLNSPEKLRKVLVARWAIRLGIVARAGREHSSHSVACASR